MTGKARPVETETTRLVRPTADEAERLRGLCRAWLYRPDPAVVRETLAEALDRADKAVYACRADGRLVAAAVVRRTGDGTAELEGIAVRREFRRRGVGRALIRAVWKAEALSGLAAETDDDAVGFYRRCGFAVEPFTRRFPDGTAVRYRCLLLAPPES